MNKIIIDKFMSFYTFIVLNEENEIEDIFIDTLNNSSILGNLYKGVVKNNLKGLEASFIDIGCEKNVYIQEENKHFKLGERVLCQIVKEESEKKAPKATTQIKIPGRYLILLLNQESINVSKNFQDKEKAERFKTLIEENITIKNGYILRTESENAEEVDILSELKYLEYLSFTIKEKFLRNLPSSLIYQNDDIVKKALYELFDSSIDKILVRDKEIFERVKELYPLKYLNNPSILEYIDSKVSLINKFSLTEKINALLSNKVVLKNGGFLLIDKTEALTAIDVNTGKFTSGITLEDTAYIINKTAAKEIPKQIKLRNISGIIIIDFIDMKEEKNKEDIVRILKEEFKNDKNKTEISKLTSLGLIEISRKKVRNSLGYYLHQNCPYCQGQAKIYSDSYIVEMVKDKIFNKIELNPTSFLKVYLNPKILVKIIEYAKDNYFEDIKNNNVVYLIPKEEFKIDQVKIEIDANPVIEIPDNALLLY